MAAATLPEPVEPAETVDLRASARRTLDFERTYLRRRWASYYAVWAVAFAVFLGAPYFAWGPVSSAVGTFGALLTFSLLDLAAVALAVPVCRTLILRGDRTHDLRGAMAGWRSDARAETLFRVLLVGLAIVGLGIGARVFGLTSFWTTVIPVFAFLLFTYHNLARTFRPIPIEGWVAIASMLTADLITIFAPVSAPGADLTVLAWSVAICIWAGCAGFARYAPRAASGEHD